MNAWKDELGDIKVRSVALPRDGGVLNAATKGRYALHSTNVAKTIKAEIARLKTAAKVPEAQAPAAPAAVVLLAARSRP